MKKIAMASHSEKGSIFYYRYLKHLFGDYANIELYYGCSDISNVNADIIIASTHKIYERIKKQVRNCEDIIIADITLKKEPLKKIMDLPKNTKALLVNINPKMAIDTIALIYQYGISHIDFIPYYPGKSDIPDVDFAVTPGEMQIVPKNIGNIINLEHRVFSQQTIVDIATRLDLSELIKTEKFQSYFQNIVVNSCGMNSLLGKANVLEKQLDLLMTMLDEGIIGLNDNGLICSLNDSIEKIMKLKKEDLIGKYLKDIIPKFEIKDAIKSGEVKNPKLYKFKDEYLVISIYQINNFDDIKSYLVLVKEFKYAEKQQHDLRKQIISKGHVAKYKFNDIIGDSKEIKGLKLAATKMAKSESSILIYGESGTGKELFAQAIHNSSKRRDYQFIAVNCGAIPENLLESELFGYDDGAFTGAKKGGKIGYFELAHKGTLFLDEISELAVGLQSKLLRIIQERELVRIGGDSVINVDVRIITATNKNLLELVRTNKFRKDLYYRLNVLPLKLPPLRSRKDDIPILLEYFKKESKQNFVLDEDIMQKIYMYGWEGNIRELKNFVERLSYIGKDKISLEDINTILPDDLSILLMNNEENFIYNQFCNKVWGDYSKYIFILDELEKGHIKKYKLGRRSLCNIATEKNMFLSEQDIRNILEELKQYRIVVNSPGRGGTRITDFGLKVLRCIKNNVI